MEPERWQEIERLYHFARELEPGEREACLRRECAGKEWLRKEVESLLALRPKVEKFIESPAIEMAAQALAKDQLPHAGKDPTERPLLQTGGTLLHYRILEKIGEGGMGVVYKALDTHLDRTVAIKVLSAEAFADPERKRRFIQEAKAASALNHPNIIDIHDINSDAGVDFIVMEHVPGKTLDRRIGHKGIRIGEALKYAVQIADALATAHAAGIVHRDLKPANIIVTDTGVIKVLDFGLAKLTEQVRGEATASTATVDGEGRPITEEGVIVGTVAYMSPEQAEGKKVDARSDIFSLGSVLYEMVTGQMAFHGTSKMSTLSAILHQEPKPVSGITPAIPPDLEKLISHCLRKDPARRFQHMDDVKVALDDVKEESDSGKVAVAAAKPRFRHRYRWALGVAAALLAIVVVPLAWHLSRPRVDIVREPIRIVPFTSLPGMEAAPRFSPDGRLVAFQWNGPTKDNFDIYVKQVGRGEPLRLTTDPAVDQLPAWSPDGSEIAFVRRSGEVASIYTVPSLGGAEAKLYESRVAVFGNNLSWSPDGRWLAFPERSAVGNPSRIYLLPLDARQKIPLSFPPATPYGDVAPEFAPDGKRIAFARVMSYFAADIWVQSVPSGEATRLTHESYEGISRLAWTADGREIVFAADVALFRIPIAGGAPQPVAGVGENTGDPAISRNQMAFVQSLPQLSQIWRMRGPAHRGQDRAAAPILPSTRQDGFPDYSPDGKRLAFMSDRSGFLEIWISGSDGSKPVQLTNLRKASSTPRWSPDGRRIVFSCRLEEDEDIYVIDADGGIPRRLTGEKSGDEVPSWSRDGRWIYFASNRSGTFQVWKMPSEGGKAVQITKGGGFSAVESFDRKMLYYLKPGQQRHGAGPIWKVPCEGGEETPVLGREISFINWALMPEGLYFSTWTHKKYLIEFFSFQTRKITSFYQEETTNERDSLTISPDSDWFVYAEIPPQESDLMLVENFR